MHAIWEEPAEHGLESPLVLLLRPKAKQTVVIPSAQEEVED